MTFLISRICVCVPLLLFLVGCSSEDDNVKRSPGGSIEGTWYTTRAFDSCSYDNSVYGIDAKSIDIHKFSKVVLYYQYEKLQSAENGQIKLKMTYLPVRTGADFIIKFADLGTRLQPLAVETLSGENLPGDSDGFRRLQDLFDITMCSEPTLFGRFKLAVGWYSKYDPELKRTPITAESLMKK